MKIRSKLIILSCLFQVLLFLGCQPKTENIAPRSDYVEVAQELKRIITHEMQDKGLPAVSIALVDNQEIVWARGFGFADRDKKIPATAETVYRVGSVSKLFTDIGIMQLVERGELDLDAPITNYLPDFQPSNPFNKPITLRQLMSHRAGLVREPPIGNYFDPTEPTLTQTVQSLNSTKLVFKPESRIKYSNAGIGTVGYVLERTQNQPFAQYLQQAVLKPLGLRNSAFEPTPAITQKLAKAFMWTYAGQEFVAPTFEMGMSPAGSMYSTVLDLGQFMSVLFNGGQGAAGQILKPETLEEMWTPQFARPGAAQGYGIGFAISTLQGHRRIGHGGAIYGFATQLYALPEEKLGVVVVTSMDVANTVMRRIANHALKSMLAVRSNEPIPEMQFTSPVDSALARRLDGKYKNGEKQIELVERNGKLFLWKGSFRSELKTLRDTLITDDRLAYGTKLMPAGENLLIVDGDVYTRQPNTKPQAMPEKWRGLIGEYGWDHNILYLLEKNGQLHALIEWFFLYPLTEISRDVFAFPNYGLYHGQNLIFKRDASGRATEVKAAEVVFKRRAVGTAENATFRIKPVKSVEKLRQTALSATPPKQDGNFLTPDLVELATLDQSIKYDIRYASTNNFMSAVFYDQSKAFMQRPAAEALIRVHRNLKKQGYGLLIHDAYRPWYVTKMFWDATPENLKHFVANPARGSIHNRGAAVDLTLYDLKTDRPVEMVSGYDEFSARAYPDYPGGTSKQRWHRELLRDAMEEQGFTVYKWEWWHFNYQTAAKYPILNLQFSEIAGE
ncbi:MAG: serine hydrolase [bacterium]